MSVGVWLERQQGRQKRILKDRLRGLDLSYRATEGPNLQDRCVYVCVCVRARVCMCAYVCETRLLGLPSPEGMQARCSEPGNKGWDPCQRRQ